MDVVTGAAVDSSGSLYITGYTNSPDLRGAESSPSAFAGGACDGGADVHPCFDAFVARIDPTGQRVIYAAYLGGSANDYATAIALDGAGNAYITGYTKSTDFPAVNAAQSAHGGGVCGTANPPTPCYDAFVAKLDPAGAAWVYVTYLGGSGDDLGQSIAVSSAGSATVTGMTTSPDFPALGALQPGWGGGASDAFAAKLDPSGAQLVFSTYLGGSGDDYGAGVAVDSEGGIYLTGYTNSSHLPATAGPHAAYSGGTCGALTSTFPCFDAFAAKLSTNGSRLEYLAYVGGSGSEYAYGIAVDAAGNATIAGMTTSQDFPVTFGAYQISGGGSNTDAFVVRLNPTGTSLTFSTYLGGLGAETATGVALDGSGRAFITGQVHGSGLPLQSPVQAASGGFYDAFLAVLNEDGTAADFSTYLGGTGNDKARALAVDRFGNAYIAGETFSADYPVARALQAGYSGGALDAMATKLLLGDLPILYAAPVQFDFGEQRVASASGPRAVTLTNIGAGELVVERFEIAGNFAVLGDCAPLAPESGCEISLRFLPSTTGPRVGSLTLRHNGWGGMTRIELSGVGLAAEVRFSVGSVVFGSQRVATKSGPQEITLTNAGTAPLDVNAITVSDHFVQSNSCPSSVPVNGRCTIQIAFTPRTTGRLEGALAVTNGLPEGTGSAALSGSGTDFSLEPLPSRMTLAAGEAATSTITAAPLGGFRESISFSCAGAPQAASCAISPQQIALDGSRPLDVMLTVTTASRTAAAPRLPRAGWPGMPATIFMLLIPVLVICTYPNHGGLMRLSPRFALVMMIGLLMAACGGGGAKIMPSGAQQGTPAGTYALTVTATSGGVPKTSTITLVVR